MAAMTIRNCITALARHLPLFRQKLRKEKSLFIRTSGRWLWNEDFQQQQTTKVFDVTALREVIANVLVPGSNVKSVKLTKFVEGGSNKVFLATTKQRRLVVKIPDSDVPPRLTTASEVATLQYLRDELDIPVPQVLAWNDDATDPVGCEYIIMEEAPGQPLNEAWPGLSNAIKIELVDEITAIQSRLYENSSKFSAYGSIYFAQYLEKLGLPFHNIPSQKESAKYCIGQLARTHLAFNGHQNHGVNCGPWTSASEHIRAIIASSSIRIKHSPNKKLQFISEPFSFPVRPVSDTSPKILQRLLETLLKAMSEVISSGARNYAPVLWHTDLHPGNIFVSPEGKITSIIDWQYTAVLPLFFAVRVPQFVDIPGDKKLWELPEDFSGMPESTQDQMTEQYNQTMLQEYYLECIKTHIPTIFDAITDPARTVMKQAESFAQISQSFEHEALTLRQCLILIQRHWHDHLFKNTSSPPPPPPPCPIVFEDDEIKKHHVDGGFYNDFKDLLQEENIPVGVEGWVHREDFKTSRKALERVIDRFMNSLDGDEVRKREFRERIDAWNITDR